MMERERLSSDGALWFFVMIVAMSEIKKDRKFERVVESIQEVFGNRGGMGLTRSERTPDATPRRKEKATAGEEMTLDKGESPVKNPEGYHESVQTIRKSQYVVGAPIAFEPGSAELSPRAKRDLAYLAEQIRGLTTRIEVRGHTSTVPLAEGSAYRDHMDLSQVRARVVYDWLVKATADGGRLDPRRPRVSGSGADEPLADRAYVESDQRKNDRVEVIDTGVLVPEFQGRQTADSYSASNVKY